MNQTPELISGTRHWLALGLILASGALAGIAPAAGQSPDQHAAMVTGGRVTYRIYCTSCHGAKGQGDGKLAGFLSYPPADLTTLARDSADGSFPTDLVQAVVDGRKQLPGHGAGDMPAWGTVFQTLTAEGEDAEQDAQRRIRELVAFLETIQAATPTP